MIPVPPGIDTSPYKMVNMNNIDLSKTSGVYVQGIFQELVDDLTDNLIVIFYNWNLAGIEIPPAYCEITRQGDKILLNGKISVSVSDIVALEGEAAILVTLYANNNGTFYPPEGADGFSHAIVEVIPRLKQELITQNGTYYPPENYDGFSMIEVDVASATLEPISITENGTYTPPSGVDGYDYITVNVSSPSYPLINYEAMGNLKTLSGFDLYGLSSSTDRIRLLDASGNPIRINWSLPFHIKLTLSMTLLTRTQVILGSNENYRGAPAIHVGSSTYRNIWFAISSTGSAWNYSLNFSVEDLTGFVWGEEFEINYIYDGSKLMCSITQGEFYVYKEVEVSGVYSNNYSTVIGWTYSTSDSATTLHFYPSKSFIKSNGVLVWGVE